MLRLMIADDEKIIRETIRNFINWEELGIEVVALCKNGIEAWQSILDDYPDIVLTDIKMPGMTGLELISRAREAGLDTEFVILSGYSEFNYAQEAMKSGVRHYLLKPCNEQEIISVMREVTEDAHMKQSQKQLHEEQRTLSVHMRQSVIRNVILEALSSHKQLDSLFRDSYVDFENYPYELYYFYFLEESFLETFLTAFYQKMRDAGLDTALPTFLYVKNTLIGFFEKSDVVSACFQDFCDNALHPDNFQQIEPQHDSFPSLKALLERLLPRITRYETVYLIDGTEKLTTRNLNRLLATAQECLNAFTPYTRTDSPEMDRLLDTLGLIDNPATLRTILADLLLNQNSNLPGSRSPISLAEFLIEISEIDSTQEILDLFQKSSARLLLFPEQSTSRQKDFIDKTLQYIDQHLSDSNLSLKSIAKNYLFMNVDYVSKQFMKQTGIKFSAYLANARIERAKQLLLESNGDSIYAIAEEVGFGNNPQYFSQIFKKSTGMTPTAYIKAMKGVS